MILFADTGEHWICSMADWNVQETCSLTIFLTPPTDRESDEQEEQHCHFPELHFLLWGLITNHVNLFMNNKLIWVRMFCHRVRADACNLGSIRFNPLSTEPGSTRVVVRTRLNTCKDVFNQMLRYFSPIVLRLCTLVLFIIIPTRNIFQDPSQD